MEAQDLGGCWWDGAQGGVTGFLSVQPAIFLRHVHAGDWVTGTGWSSTAISSPPGVCGGQGEDGSVKHTHTRVECETDIPRRRPVMSLPSGSRRGRQTQRLLGLEEVCVEGDVDGEV